MAVELMWYDGVRDSSILTAGSLSSLGHDPIVPKTSYPVQYPQVLSGLL